MASNDTTFTVRAGTQRLIALYDALPGEAADIYHTLSYNTREQACRWGLLYPVGAVDEDATPIQLTAVRSPMMGRPDRV